MNFNGFEHLPCVVALVDNNPVYGRSNAEHDRTLRKVSVKARKTGPKFNRDKLHVAVERIKYFGHILTSSGIEPDPKKVTAIRDMPPPTNKAELQTVLGIMTYLSEFVRNLSNVSNPMRKLLTQNNQFVWDEPQKKAFEKSNIF